MMHAAGITYAEGFKAWGEHVGLKRFKKDLAVVVSDVPATVAAVFTTNQAKAAPVQWNQNILKAGNKVKAILVNSGQANSCTGAQGTLNAALMAEKLAEQLNCGASEIILASTGVIGAQINITKALAGIAKVAGKIRDDQFAAGAAAEAIITTDSCVKQCAMDLTLGGKQIKIGAMAKGSGMIHPNMATMLAFITTDAAIAPALLQKALKTSVDATYNMISVDGDTSTNDMVVLLSSGLAGNEEITVENDDFHKFCKALGEVNLFLAKKIACDVNGATKRIAVSVVEAQNTEAARKVARKVVASNLVKASIHKCNAHWGRVIAAVGSAGVEVDVHSISISFASELGTITAFAFGEQHPHFTEDAAAKILSTNEIEIQISLKQGEGSAAAWGCDMEFDPIRSSGQTQTHTKVLAGVG